MRLIVAVSINNQKVEYEVNNLESLERIQLTRVGPRIKSGPGKDSAHDAPDMIGISHEEISALWRMI